MAAVRADISALAASLAETPRPAAALADTSAPAESLADIPPPPLPPDAGTLDKSVAHVGVRIESWEDLRGAPVEVSRFEPMRRGPRVVTWVFLALAVAAAAAFVAPRYLPQLDALFAGRGGTGTEAAEAKFAAERTEFNKRFALLEARGAANWAAPDLAKARTLA